MRTPVGLIIFNRPEATKKVLAEIARAKPPKLFVIADGPREEVPGDSQKCAAARAVIESIDWDCEVVKNYSDKNLGCGRGPGMGMSWVFDQVEEAIILEDDCVPHQSFFRFCEELLERYSDDARVMQISGYNFRFGRQQGPCSYFFSHHNLCWGGFASWKRAWKHFDAALKSYPTIQDMAWLLDIVKDKKAADYWQEQFEQAHACSGMVDYWDYQWTFACWTQNGLSIWPNTNLLSNVGFGQDATHTHSAKDGHHSFLLTKEMSFPLQHPEFIIPDHEADQFFIERLVLPSLTSHVNRPGRIKKMFLPLVTRYPSLKSSRTVQQRLWEKCSALFSK